MSERIKLEYKLLQWPTPTPTKSKQSEKKCRIGPLQIGYSTLADDFTIVSSIIYSLQEQMNTVTKYANMWGYELN